jgi:hypothetical protein
LIQSQESVSPKLIKAYQSQLQKLPLVNSLSYYYDTIAQHSALKDHFLKYFNHVIFKDGLHWNRSSEVYESESLNTPDDFTDFMIRRNMIFDKDYTPDKNTKKISEKMSLSAAYHEHVDEFSRMILTVFKVYLSISNIKQKIWLQYHSLLQAGKIKTFYHQLFQSKYIPISHEGLVITEENSHGIVYKTKLVPQHEFSRLNFTAGTQSKYQKPISAKENDQRVKSIETLHWASDRIMVVSVGRFNPPTIGHMLVFNKLNELRKTLKLHKEQVHLFSTETEGNTQNPLSFKDKDMIIKKIVQDLYKVNDSRITTRIKEHDSIHPHSVVEELSQQLIEKHKQNLKPLLIIYVAGSEYVRGAEEELSKRLQMFANNLGVYFMFVQSGERIDDDRDMIQHELLKTISATRLRRAIKENDYVYVLSSEKEPIQHMQDTFKKGTKTLFNYKDKVYYWSKSKQLYQCIEPQSLLATTINKDYNLQKEILDKTRIGLG